MTKVNTSDSDPHEAVSQLCPACGLCCNGALFADVKLQRGDHARHLKSLGLVLERKGKIVRFSQPCACFDGKLCRIYADRPVRCRTFECRLLQDVQSGKLTVSLALARIRRARRYAGTVLNLVRKLGQQDEHLSLSERYQKVFAEPYDLSGDLKVIRLRGQLLQAVSKLVNIMERDFLT
jgi:Fe-S-cluster containining protein